MEGMRLWEADDNFTADYCEACPDSARGNPCADCPRPRVLPECEPLVAAYIVCQTQWRVGMGGRVGLDYTACRVAMEAQRAALALPPEAEAFEALQLIEAAMLQADAERHARDREQRAER